MVDGEEEEQRRRAIDGVVDITVLCLKQLKREELADSYFEHISKTLMLEKNPVIDSYFHSLNIKHRLNDITGDMFLSNFRLKTVHTFGSDGGVAKTLITL